MIVYNLISGKGMNDNDNRYTKSIVVTAVILTVTTTTTILISSQRIGAFLMPVEDIAGQRKAVNYLLIVSFSFKNHAK